MKHFIQALGGSGRLAKRLRKPQNTVSTWMGPRGIPKDDKLRKRLAAIAKAQGVPLPARFLGRNQKAGPAP